MAGADESAGEGLGVGLHLLTHLRLCRARAPALKGRERGGVREEPRRGQVARSEEGAGGGLGVGRRLLPHLRLRRVPALEGLHEQRLHGCGGGRQFGLGFDHPVARRGAAAGRRGGRGAAEREWGGDRNSKF